MAFDVWKTPIDRVDLKNWQGSDLDHLDKILNTLEQRDPNIYNEVVGGLRNRETELRLVSEKKLNELHTLVNNNDLNKDEIVGKLNEFYEDDISSLINAIDEWLRAKVDQSTFKEFLDEVFENQNQLSDEEKAMLLSVVFLKLQNNNEIYVDDFYWWENKTEDPVWWEVETSWELWKLRLKSKHKDGNEESLSFQSSLENYEIPENILLKALLYKTSSLTSYLETFPERNREGKENYSSKWYVNHLLQKYAWNRTDMIRELDEITVTPWDEFDDAKITEMFEKKQSVINKFKNLSKQNEIWKWDRDFLVAYLSGYDVVKWENPYFSEWELQIFDQDFSDNEKWWQNLAIFTNKSDDVPNAVEKSKLKVGDFTKNIQKDPIWTIIGTVFSVLWKWFIGWWIIWLIAKLAFWKSFFKSFLVWAGLTWAIDHFGPSIIPDKLMEYFKEENLLIENNKSSISKLIDDWVLENPDEWNEILSLFFENEKLKNSLYTTYERHKNGGTIGTFFWNIGMPREFTRYPQIEAILDEIFSRKVIWTNAKIWDILEKEDRPIAQTTPQNQPNQSHQVQAAQTTKPNPQIWTNNPHPPVQNNQRTNVPTNLPQPSSLTNPLW